MWRVELLGNLQIVRSDNQSVIVRFESRKVGALLARIALFPARVHPREELAAYLWPDADRASGLARLRHVLSSLGRQTADGEIVLGPLFVADRFGVRIGPNVWCDAVQFEKAVAQKRFADARALYAGDLLPGFYDNWIVNEQERLRAVFDCLPPAPVQRGPAAPAAAMPSASAVPQVSPQPETKTSAVRGFLPHYLTAFWGREAEKKSFADLLFRRRLITIVGPVGCGKTRFMVEAVRAANAEPVFEQTAFEQTVFVPLEECAVPEHVASRVRVALGLPPSNEPPLEQIAVALGGVRLLLLLNNAEHLTEGQGGAAGEVIEELLARLPLAHCVISSRRLLHVSGEQAFPLHPLPLPDPNAPLDAVRQNPCVALLCDRAQAVRPDWTITTRNCREAALLCRELEGIPLAIELAASRIRAFSLQQMVEQMQNGGEQNRWALTTPPAFVRASKASRRHNSLHEAVTAGWHMLPSPRLQEFLANVSVLPGQWNAAFAGAISDETNENAALLLEELADHSFVQTYENASEAGGETRFALLQTIREFARDQLPPPKRDALRQRYRRYVLEQLQSGTGIADAITPSDLPVWEGALQAAIADNQTRDALALCAAFDDVWLRIGSTRDALALVQRALLLPSSGGDDTRLRAEACEVGSCLAALCLDLFLARDLAHAAWENAQNAAHGDVSARAFARLAQGRAAYVQREPHAVIVGFLDEAERAARQEQEACVGVLSSVLGLRGVARSHVRDYENAERDMMEAQTLREQQTPPSPVRVNQVRFNRAVVASERGNQAHALALLHEVRVSAWEISDVKREAEANHNIGVILSEQKQWAESVPFLRDAVCQMHRLGMEYGLAFALWNLARPLWGIGETETAVSLLAFAHHFWSSRGGTLTGDDETYLREVFAAVEETSGPSLVAQWQKQSEKWTLREAVDAALGETEK